MTLTGIVVSPDGAARARARRCLARPIARSDIGVEAAERLLAAGADEILEALR